MQESYHAHPIDVHLATGIFETAKLKRSADAHAGIVDENINAPFIVYNLFDGCFDLRIIRGFDLDVGDARDMLHVFSVCPVDFVPVSGESFCHGSAESGSDASNEDNHIILLLQFP